MLLAALAFGGVQFAGQVMGAYGAYEAGRQNAKDMRWNAAMARVNAQDTVAQAEVAISDLKKDTAALTSAQTASYAAQGVDVSKGVAVDLVEDTNKRMYEDVDRIRDRARKEAWGLLVESKQHEQAARRSAKRGRYALMGGLIGGAGQAGATVMGAGR